MAYSIMQALVVLLEVKNVGEESEFPFLAALILIAIIGVVAVGDMHAAKKKDKDKTTKL